MTTYADYLERKAQLDGMDGFTPTYLPDFLFDFQAALDDESIEQSWHELVDPIEDDATEAWMDPVA